MDCPKCGEQDNLHVEILADLEKENRQLKNYIRELQANTTNPERLTQPQLVSIVGYIQYVTKQLVEKWDGELRDGQATTES